MKINIKKLHENARMPTYSHPGDGCFDLTATTVGGFHAAGLPIDRDNPLVCGTGLAFSVPAGHVMLVFSRSGMGFKQGVRLSNSVAIIDHGYSGEVMVKLASDMPAENEKGEALPVHIIRPGDRIAQAMIIPIEHIEFDIVDSLDSSDRGSTGFGDSGK